jgi:Cof subfamily protein (haloacid dehalogenase superfamily)
MAPSNYGWWVPLGLVCLDVDGTLVGERGVPTDGVWAAADRARASGVHLAICTARLGLGSAWGWARRLDPNGWHMFQTGASIIHTGTDQMHSTALPVGTAKECEAIAAEHDWVFELYSDRDYVVTSSHDVAVRHAGLLGIDFVVRGADDLSGVAVRAQIIASDDDVERAVALVPHGCTASAATSPIIPGYHFVSITADTVSKASGVTVLAELLGLSLDRVMMVGDGQNDVSALEAVTHSVAMGNAHPDAVAVSKYRVADVEADGVAEALDLALRL